jgi:hypothetical protein
MSIRRPLIAGMLLLSVIAALCANAGLASADVSGMSISPASQTVSPGANFEIIVTITTNVPSRGAQCALSFDPALMQCNSVTEGSFYKNWAQANSSSTIPFPEATINNNTGQVSDIGFSIVGAQPEGGPSGSGEFCTYHMTAKSGSSGTSSITLSSVSIADQAAVLISGISVNNGQVIITLPQQITTPPPSQTTTPPSQTTTLLPSQTTTPSTTPSVNSNIQPAPECDVNGDEKVDQGDIAAINLRLGQTGAPGWVPEDVNKDGTVSLLDIVVTGLHQGESFSVANATPLPTATPDSISAPVATSTPPSTPVTTQNMTAESTQNLTVIDLSGMIDSGGNVEKDFQQGNIQYNQKNWIAGLEIKRGTRALTKDGTVLRAISIQPSLTPPPSPPSGGYILGFAADFSPGGATFSIPISVTFAYDPALLPPGVKGTDLALAFFDTQAGKWIMCDYTIDTVNHRITGYISHFTVFAILTNRVHGIGWAWTGIMIIGELAIGAIVILLILKKRRAPAKFKRVTEPLSPSAKVDITEGKKVIPASLEKVRTGNIKPRSGLSKVRLEITDRGIVLDQDNEIVQDVAIVRGKSPLLSGDGATKCIAFYLGPGKAKSESPMLITLEYDPDLFPQGVIKVVVTDKSTGNQVE